MIAIKDINELNKIIREQLIIQSELDSNRVRNALTTYGATLDKLLLKEEYESICKCDDLMLFELRTRENDSDVSMTEYDNDIIFYKSYTIYVILYGDNAATIMNKLIARMRSQIVRQTLYENGVYLQEMKNDISFNEFKNDTLWHRHDVEILISCKMNIEQIRADIDFENLNDIKIIKETNK